MGTRAADKGLAVIPAGAGWRRGIYPDLGPVTARQFLAAPFVHDLGHTHQVVESMAYRHRRRTTRRSSYRAAPGRWYLMRR